MQVHALVHPACCEQARGLSGRGLTRARAHDALCSSAHEKVSFFYAISKHSFTLPALGKHCRKFGHATSQPAALVKSKSAYLGTPVVMHSSTHHSDLTQVNVGMTEDNAVIATTSTKSKGRSKSDGSDIEVIIETLMEVSAAQAFTTCQLLCCSTLCNTSTLCNLSVVVFTTCQLLGNE
jgi:hypothetical protein